MQPAQTTVATALAWSLQTALGAGFAIACAGLAVTFRRPAMRLLAVVWTLLTIAFFFVWSALASQSVGLGPNDGVYFAVLAFPFTPALAFLLFRHLLQLLAGQTERPFPRPVILVTTASVALAFASAVMILTKPADPQAPGVVIPAMSSGLTIVSYLVLALLAWRAHGRARVHRGAIKLLGFSLLLLLIRSTGNLVVVAVAMRSGKSPEFGVAASTVQISLLVIAGVTQLIAVLSEERASIVAQAEQLRAAESAMAASQRLESLGRMAAAVAHDFNNLLGVITMSVEAARLDNPDASPSENDDLSVIKAAAERGAALIQQLLAFARQAPQQVSRFDVNKRLDQLTGLLKRVTGIDRPLVIAFAATPLEVEMDATQFDQVVMNLVVNARDATGVGGAITISLSPQTETMSQNSVHTSRGRELIRLSVADTGSGIPADVLAHIFEPFYSTKQEGEGTGLGLATCDAIVQRAGGRIDVHSEPGKGTQFDVLIPRVARPLPTV